MKSVLFFSESLDGGGAEGILENTVRFIDKSQFDVNVVSETDSEFHTEAIKKYTKHQCFVHKNTKSSPLRELINKLIIKISLLAPEWFVRRFYIRGKYDVEIAFCEGYATKLIGNAKMKNTKKVAWVHTDVINHPWSEAVFGSKEAEQKCYENFDAIVCVSETIKESFIKKYGMAEKVHVVYNVMDSEKIIDNSKEPVDFSNFNRPLLMLCGRLTQVKGYDRMIHVASMLKKDGFDFGVLIMGSGCERDNIENLIDEYDVRDRITLMEYQANPHKYMKNADIFVCSSYAEGYSTVVAEAVLLGKPVVTTECSGMREIFGNSECGIICENSEKGLYEALKKVLSEPKLLEHYCEEAAKRKNAFSTEERVRAVESFLCQFI